VLVFQAKVDGQTKTFNVWRVEQRLKYLGFPAMGTGTGNSIKDFAVDGRFGNPEQHALKLFEKVVRYQGTGLNARYNNGANDSDGEIESGDQGQAKVTKDWLNAYNAPHWMNVYESVRQAPGFIATTNQQEVP
jgi:hypothetical protein